MSKPGSILKCIIVDDEPLALALLSDYVGKFTGLELIAATSDPVKALQLVKIASPDLIFLDMQMPELNGVQFLKILQQRVMVIITTAYSEYALDGYEHHVVDYLLKPIMPDRFMIAVEKAQQRHDSNYAVSLKEKEHDRSSRPAFIFIKTDHRTVKVDLADIYYLEGARDYVIIHTISDQILTAQSMKNLEELLPFDQFIRVHKSYIIALSKINYIERSRIAIKDQLIPVSDSYKESFLNIMKGG
jgi:DNA-binding LytR/AlgR family response regulator